ncbi:hypothetical protein [Halostagnicola kamekurae]|uniref:Uncharacterized protein n=1 Tax=Halostagnicola kamekurae TaxID=619731 RepID=A0A1I6RTG5_9EURY|nr:hypothetical protein [Halostagnicola kamekurae]SFS67962.1 hypothetical protein SAMN04488556_2095 [Halostagnicola kamekurae]
MKGGVDRIHDRSWLSNSDRLTVDSRFDRWRRSKSGGSITWNGDSAILNGDTPLSEAGVLMTTLADLCILG